MSGLSREDQDRYTFPITVPHLYLSQKEVWNSANQICEKQFRNEVSFLDDVSKPLKIKPLKNEGPIYFGGSAPKWKNLFSLFCKIEFAGNTCPKSGESRTDYYVDVNAMYKDEDEYGSNYDSKLWVTENHQSDDFTKIYGDFADHESRFKSGAR